jgi:hypothetical protein
LETIPSDQQETQQTLALNDGDGVTTLGLLWNPKGDQLQVRNNSSSTSTNFTVSTKQQVLAVVASIFDSLGLLTPSVVVYKFFTTIVARSSSMEQAALSNFATRMD